MKKVHDILIKNRWLIAISFLIASGIFFSLNSEFSKVWNSNVSPVDTKELSGSYSIVPQPFSNFLPPKKIPGDEWSGYQDQLQSMNLKDLNGKIFWTDNIWAFLLILFLYILAFNGKDFTKLSKVLMICLVIAYASDLVENFTYLGYFSGTAELISYVAFIKMSLYLAGFLMMLYSIIR